MITAEQLQERTRGLGGSDAHILAGIDGPGHKTRLDLWARKRRGLELEIAPMVAPDYDDDKCAFHGKVFAKVDPRRVGNAFEAAIVALYEESTGDPCHEAGTEIHDDKPYMRANGDRLVGIRSHGLEVKMVGSHALDRWAGSGFPPYTTIQCQWCMNVFDLDRWDAIAWLGGTEVRIGTIYRDPEICAGLEELADNFWINHVLADIPPDPQDAEDLRRFIGSRHPLDNGKILELRDIEGREEDAAQAEALARHLAKIKRASKNLLKHKKETEAKLIALVGENKGIAGPWGKFSYGSRAGQISWKNVAEEINEGPVDTEIVETHRGAGYRQSDFRMFKAKK